MQKLNIGIVGAGIAGLTVATLLAQSSHKVQVFDQFDDPKPVGSGLVIQPVGREVLGAIGAAKEAHKKGQLITRMLGNEATSKKPVLDVWYSRSQNPEHYGLAIHRASLFQAILNAALSNGVDLVPSHTVIGRRGNCLTFANGRTSAPFDLIIDASGTNSALSPITTKPLPYGAIWSTVPWPEETWLPYDHLSQTYRRADKMLGVLPCGKMPGSDTNMTAIFWSMPRSTYSNWQDNPLDDWKSEAISLWPAFASFLKPITQHSQMTWAKYSHGTLKKPYADNIAFIGDSAHQASPQLGQGANMALLDAMALSQALNAVPLPEAFALYAKIRRLHVRIYQFMSYAFTPQYQSDSKILPMLRDKLFFPLSQVPPISNLLTHLVRGDMVAPLARVNKN